MCTALTSNDHSPDEEAQVESGLITLTFSRHPVGANYHRFSVLLDRQHSALPSSGSITLVVSPASSPYFLVGGSGRPGLLRCIHGSGRRRAHDTVTYVRKVCVVSELLEISAQKTWGCI